MKVYGIEGVITYDNFNDWSILSVWRDVVQREHVYDGTTLRKQHDKSNARRLLRTNEDYP